MKFSATAVSVFACQAAMVSGFSGYLSSLVDAPTAPLKSASYSGFNKKPKAPESKSDYLSLLNAGPECVLKMPTTQMLGSQQQPQAMVDYMASLGGSVGKAKPASYSPFNSKPRAPVRDSSYLDALNAGPDSVLKMPMKELLGAQQQPKPTVDYMTSLGGSSGKMKASSYSPFKSKPQAQKDSGYLGALSNAAITISNVAPASSSNNGIDYLSALGSTSGKMKPASYSPFKSKPRAPENDNGYLGALSSTSMTFTSAAPVESSTSGANYLTSLAGPIGQKKRASYSPFNSKPRAPEKESGYLGALSNIGSTMTVDTPATELRTVGAADYMSALAGAAGPMKRASYSPFNSKPRAPEKESGYLGALSNTGTMTMTVDTPAAASKTVGAADYMTALAGTTGPLKRASYSPFNSKPRAPEQESGYLGALSSTTVVVSPIASPSKATSNSDINYMSSLAGTNSVPKAASYSPFKKTW